MREAIQRRRMLGRAFRTRPTSSHIFPFACRSAYTGSPRSAYVATIAGIAFSGANESSRNANGTRTIDPRPASSTFWRRSPTSKRIRVGAVRVGTAHDLVPASALNHDRREGRRGQLCSIFLQLQDSTRLRVRRHQLDGENRGGRGVVGLHGVRNWRRRDRRCRRWPDGPMLSPVDAITLPRPCAVSGFG